MGSDTKLEVRKEITVALPPEDVFRLFTEEMGSWWPLATHSIYEDADAGVVFERELGGRLYERTTDGREADWGLVTAWEPPTGFTVSWKPNLDPDAARTSWTIRFDGDGEGHTRIELTHTGWEGLEDPTASRSAYDTGWDLVLSGLPDIV